MDFCYWTRNKSDICRIQSPCKENADVINCEFSFEPVGSMEKEQNSKTIGAHLIMRARKTTLGLNLEANANTGQHTNFCRRYFNGLRVYQVG